MLYMIFQSGGEPVLTQRIVNGFEAILKNAFFITNKNYYFCRVSRKVITTHTLEKSAAMKSKVRHFAVFSRET